jgi:E3 ubiquitin-protein ligase HUWE1
MSKTLLTESEIRKMMNFANIGGLAENFIDQTIDEGYGMEEDDLGEVDTLDEELDALEEEEDAEGDMDADMGGDMDMEGADDDMDMEDEGDDMDMEDEGDDMDMEDEGDEPEGDMSAEVQIDEDDLPALQTARDILDQILQAEGGGDDMDMEDEGDEPEGDEEPMDEGMYEEGEGMSEEDIMEEVARRVAKRLLETKNKG